MTTNGFTLQFQEHLLASVIFDGDFLKKHIDEVSPEQFSDEVLRAIAETSLNFYRIERETPSKEALLESLKEKVAPGRKFQDYQETVEAIFEKVGVNTRHYQERLLGFSRVQALSQALRTAHLYLETGEIDKIQGEVAKASQIGQLNGHSRLYDYFEAIKERALEYMRQSKAPDPNRLSTGFIELDQHMGGGLCKGELGVVVASPKGGKTTMLINLAANALLQGKTVGYVTLELSKKMISSKLDSRFFGFSMLEIKKKPKSFFAALEAIKQKLTSKILIYEYPTKSIGIEKLAALIEKDSLDILFVDYGQLLKSGKDRGDRRHEITDSYEGMRRIAGETQVPIWTAHQSNRPGAGSKIIQPEHIAEDYNVLAIVDFALSLNQTPEEKRANDLRLYIMASRIGASGELMNFKANWETASISPAFQAEELGA